MKSKVRKLILTSICLGMLVSPICAFAQNYKIELDTNKQTETIDRHIFGQFTEHLGKGVYGGIWVGEDSKIPNIRGIRKDVVAALKEIKVPVVRWPGGCFADEYHWRNGIGKPYQRRTTLNPNWGGVLEPNTFGSHEFMDFASQIGADAYISVNLGSGSVVEAADWLEYMTSDKPTALAHERAQNGHKDAYKVPYLGIGNESWGCGGSMTPEYYVNQLKTYSRFVRNYGSGQNMQNIAVGPNADQNEYTEAIMKAWSQKDGAWNISGLSLHYYSVGAGWPPKLKAIDYDKKDYALLIADSLKIDGHIQKTAAIMDKYDPSKKIGIMVDEWGAWLEATPNSTPGFLEQQNSQRDAIIAALNLNIFSRHADRVKMANIAQMVNVLQALVVTDNEKMILTPTYHLFKMYVPFQDAKFIPTNYDAGSFKIDDITLPEIDVISARAKDGKIWLSLTNINPEKAIDVEIDISGTKIKSADGHILSADKFNIGNSFAKPENVAPKTFKAKVNQGKLKINLVPASVVVVVLEE